MLRKIMCSLVVAVLLGIGSAQGAIYFAVTDITGAQVQVDENHTQYWTYAVNENVPEVAGGLFVMKDGPQTTEPITFDIIMGTIADFGSKDPLLRVTKGPNDFTGSFEGVYFEVPDGSEITLLEDVTYTAILYSNAVDAQNAAYFIKGGGQAYLYDSDTGEPADGVEIDFDHVPDVPAVPEPATLAIWSVLGVAGLALRRFKSA
ncbi:MAG: PEP-CTERM sorting domain-containing protein [Thermoguttaceae bacterium]|jgi:hypothetical protein